MASHPPNTTLIIHHSLHSTTTLASYLIIPVLITTAFFFLALLILKQKLHCRCQICHAYAAMSWSKEFANLCDWYTHLLKKSPTKTLHVHALGNIITADPKNVEYILKTRFDNYPKGKSFSSILGDLLGKGIFNVDGDAWMFQKKMASNELGRVSLRSYCFEVVSDEIERRLSPLLSSSVDSGDRVLDLQNVFRRFSFDTICRFSFGMDPTCLESCHSMNSFAASFDLATRLSAERAMCTSPLVWKTKRLLRIGSEKRLHDAIKVIDSMAQEIILQKRKLGLLGHQDLLSHFMLVVQDETYLRDIVVSFILAGRDSVASALSSFFFLLASHPEVEEAIATEADRVVGKDQYHLKTFEQIKDLPYLQAAVYESMRLYPPVQFDSKFCIRDDVLPDGTRVRRGARVTYHPYAMGRVEEIWGEDCLEFKPERWLRDGLFQQESPFKYPVFQAGPRVCLGKEMALVEIKTVAFWLIRHYSVKLAASDGSQVPKFSPGLTATFRDGLKVVVTPKRSRSDFGHCNAWIDMTNIDGLQKF